MACSGAATVNIFRTSNGGQGEKGEPTQAQMLRYVAQVSNAKVVVLSIGGNDLGFADIIRACAQAYAARTGPCRTRQQAVVDAKRNAAFKGVDKAIDEVRAVMAESGYTRTQYRFIVQSYGSPVPRAAEARYGELRPAGPRSAAACNAQRPRGGAPPSPGARAARLARAAARSSPPAR